MDYKIIKTIILQIYPLYIKLRILVLIVDPNFAGLSEFKLFETLNFIVNDNYLRLYTLFM